MTMPFAQALGHRRSSRNFLAKPLDDTLLATLLWACAGRSDENGHRTVPSARNCQEVRAFVFDADGVWLFEEGENALTLTAEGDKRAETTIGQDFVASAPVTIVFAVEADRCGKLISSRAERCMHIDTGCMVQSLLLAATALGLAAVPRGNFDVEQVRNALGLGEAMTPTLCVTVGKPSL